MSTNNPPSNVKSTPLNPPSMLDRAMLAGSKAKSISTNKSIGIIIWLLGAWLTTRALAQMGVPEPVNIFIGIAAQLALTRAESPIWRGRGYPKMAIGALLVDVAINTPGAFIYTKNVGSTDFWTMLKEITNSPGLEANTPTQLALAIGVGTFTAAAAEYFFNLPD